MSDPMSDPGIRALESISDRALLRKIHKLSDCERKTILSILLHIIEIDRRELYLPMGYSSLFDFCVNHLGYCEGTAVRRIKVARCIRDIPQAYHALSSGKVSLTNLARITGIISDGNSDEILSAVAGASKREVELLVEAGFTPVEAIRIATLNGALYLNQADKIGTLEPGKQADMVLIKGNPAKEIADIEKVETVFKYGVGYDSAKLIESVRGTVGIR